MAGTKFGKHGSVNVGGVGRHENASAIPCADVETVAIGSRKVGQFPFRKLVCPEARDTALAGVAKV